MGNPTCAAFEGYKEVPETLPLGFSDDNVTWVASKLCGTSGAVVAEAIEMRNWLLCFGCASEEFLVVVADLANWMDTPPPGLLTMVWWHVASLHWISTGGGCPVGIGETLCRAIAKFVMRAAGDQAKMACRSLQLCAGLEVGIQGSTHAMAQRQKERNVQESEGGLDEVSEEKRMAEAGGAASLGREEAVGGVGEVPRPPGDLITAEEGEGRASDNLRTTMEEMEVGGYEMDKGEEAESYKDNAKVEGGGG